MISMSENCPRRSNSRMTSVISDSVDMADFPTLGTTVKGSQSLYGREEQDIKFSLEHWTGKV
jgi:hypothetical protein